MFIIKMPNHVTFSDEISNSGTPLQTKAISLMKNKTNHVYHKNA